MLRRLLIITVLGPAALLGADEPTTSPSTREKLRSRLAEETKTGNSNAAVAPAPQPKAASAPAETPEPAVNAAQEPATVKTPEQKKPADPVTVLPKMEVKRPRITELDRELEQQEKAIAREKANTKPSKLDEKLNDAKIAKPLAIFGGESAQFRQRVASERVSLMEDEKDLLEAIAQAKTKEEKAELKRQLQILREHRREMDRTLR